MRKQGIRLIAYLDDILIIGKTAREVAEHTSQLITHLASLGFILNMKKSCIVPSHKQEFLGHSINTKTMMLSLSKDKLKQIKYEARRLMCVQQISAQKLASFLGLLNSTCQMVFPARMKARWLQLDLRYALQKGEWEIMVQLSPEALASLEWWYQDLEHWNGHSIIQTQAECTFYGGTTDASKDGYGIATQVSTQGLWTNEESEESINYLELKTILLATQLNQDTWANKTVLIKTDNTSAMAYVNKMGGTSNRKLLDLADQIWAICLAKNILLQAQHIAGVDNMAADQQSRKFRDRYNYTLNPTLFEVI